MKGIDLYYRWVSYLYGTKDNVCYSAAPPWYELSDSRQAAWNRLAETLKDENN